MKVALYARYSSDNQRDASIADQLRICREFATRQGWTVTQEFTDHAISGATLLRSGFQALMRDALNRRFDVVLAESLDRFSRDQEDTAGLFKRLTFAGVNIVTIAEGDITHLHIGFKGTMNALFLKDLADKTHRGLRGLTPMPNTREGIAHALTDRRHVVHDHPHRLQEVGPVRSRAHRSVFVALSIDAHHSSILRLGPDNYTDNEIADLAVQTIRDIAADKLSPGTMSFV
jgi:hypothetical protein